MIEGMPESLHLVESIANSLDVETGADDLATREKAQAWLEAHELGSLRLREQDLEALRMFRAGVRALLMANHGDPVDEPAVRRLNGLARTAPMVMQFGDGGIPHLEAHGSGLERAFAQIMQGIPSAVASGTWQRLKICRSDTCAVAFYDLSKNRSRSWCSMEVCGNRMKVRSFRQRHARTT